MPIPANSAGGEFRRLSRGADLGTKGTRSLSGIEVMHMIKKGQVRDFGKIQLSAAQRFYPLVS